MTEPASPKPVAGADSASRLLDRPLPASYREDWARHFARPAEAEDAEAMSAGEGEAAGRRVFLFRLGAEWFALPAGLIDEVTEPRRVHSLPHRRDALVRGIVNVRGELLVCIALAGLIGAAAAEGARGGGRAFARLVVIGAGTRRVAFEADEVHGLHVHGAGDLRPVPASVGKATDALATAVIGWEERAVGRLDGAALMAAIDRSLS